MVEEREKELVGLLGPKSLREASNIELAKHCKDFVASLVERNRGRARIAHVRCRLQLPVKECRWRLLRDVTAESFVRWRTRKDDLSAKTLNEYLGHANALLNWMQRQGQCS